MPGRAGPLRHLLNEGRRLYAEITAEVPVATYPAGQEPDPGRVAGVDPGIIHPFAVAGPDQEGLLVSGRAIRAETFLHLGDAKRRTRATARRAPTPGQAGSRRWKKTRARQRRAEAVRRRRVRQAQHEASAEVVAWAVARRIGTLKIGDRGGCWAWMRGGGITSGSGTGGSASSWPASWTRPPAPGSPPSWSTSAARRRPARAVLGGCPRPPAAFSAARTAGSPGTVILPVPRTSPPGLREAGPSGPGPPCSRSGSRTAGLGIISLMCPVHGVTPGAALIAAAPQGPLAGRGPPRLEAGTSLAHRPQRKARIA